MKVFLFFAFALRVSPLLRLFRHSKDFAMLWGRDVGSNPAQGKYSFPQKLSSVEFPLTFSQFLLNLDCESICDPPGGGDTLLAQGIYLTDSLH